MARRYRNNLKEAFSIITKCFFNLGIGILLPLLFEAANPAFAQDTVAPAGSPSATPVDLTAIKHDIHQNKKNLAAIKKKIEQQKKIKKLTEAREKNVLSHLQQVDQALGKLRREKEANQEELDETRDRLDRLQSTMMQNRLLLEQDRTLLQQRLRALYRMSFRQPLLGGLLSSENPADLARKLKFETLLAQSNEKLMEGTLESETDLETASTEWVAEGRRKEKLLGSLGRQEKELGQKKRNRSVFLASLKRQKENQEQLLSELNEAAGELQQKFSSLISQAKIASQQAAEAKAEAKTAKNSSPAGQTAEGAGLKVVRGKIPWPVSGKIMLNFGRSKNKEFNEMVDNTGIQIAAPAGTPIRAVAKGLVRYADWFKGYGKLVILDHGKGYYSLYAQAAELNVAEGTEVAQGQILGTVGDTGSLYADQWGTSLYFEIRHDGLPEDPVRWLTHQR